MTLHGDIAVVDDPWAVAIAAAAIDVVAAATAIPDLPIIARASFVADRASAWLTSRRQD